MVVMKMKKQRRKRETHLPGKHFSKTDQLKHSTFPVYTNLFCFFSSPSGGGNYDDNATEIGDVLVFPFSHLICLNFELFQVVFSAQQLHHSYEMYCKLTLCSWVWVVIEQTKDYCRLQVLGDKSVLLLRRSLNNDRLSVNLYFFLLTHRSCIKNG